MKYILLGFLAFAFVLSNSTTVQAQCPPDDGNGPWTSVIDQPITLASGCQVKVSYCYRDVFNPSSSDTWERQFYTTAVTVISGCDGMSYSDMLHQVSEALNLGITTFPLCDGPLHGKVVTDFVGACWELSRREILGVWFDMISICGNGKCRRTCDYCLGLVNNKYQAIESNCTYDNDYTEGCIDISGGWEYDKCYHLPCTTGW